MRGTERMDWKEAFSNGTDPPAQAGTREEVETKKCYQKICQLTAVSPRLQQDVDLQQHHGRRLSDGLDHRQDSAGRVLLLVDVDAGSYDAQIPWIKRFFCMGRGGGPVVSVLAFYSDDLSSNPADYFNNFLYEKTKISKKDVVDL